MHKIPIKIVAMTPVTRPLLWNAFGIASIPVPKLPFSKWINVSVFLRTKLQRNVQKPKKHPIGEYSRRWIRLVSIFVGIVRVPRIGNRRGCSIRSEKTRIRYVVSGCSTVIWKLLGEFEWVLSNLLTNTEVSTDYTAAESWRTYY